MGLSIFDKQRIEKNFFEKMEKEGIDVTSGAMREELVLGAILICEKGDSPSIFIIDPVHNLGFNNLPTAIRTDCVKDTNIFPFGTCTCAMEKDDKPYDCLNHMVLPEEWTDPTLSSGLEEAFLKAGKDPTMSMAAFIHCEYGFAKIYPITSGQSMYELLQSLQSEKLDLKDFLNKLNGLQESCAFGGDPVNMVTGNFIYQKEDITIPGSFPLSFTRFYNSIGSTKSTLGKNWTHNFNIALTENEEYAEILFEDGHAERYTLNKDASFIAPQDKFNKLERKDDGYLLTLQSQLVYWFAKDGQLQYTEDTNGNRAVLTYENGLLASVQNAGGEFAFSYNTDCLLDAITDHTGRVVSYEYHNKRLYKATLPSGGSYQYGYNAQNRLDTITNPEGITGIQNEYDDDYRVIKQTFPDGGSITMDYESELFTTVSTEQNGNIVKYVRDEKFRTVKTAYRDSEELYEYNENDQRTMFTDRNGNATRFEYDKSGNVNKIIDALQNEAEITYNKFNKPERFKKPNGGMITTQYDGCGNPVKTTDPCGHSIHLVYNGQGLPEHIKLPNGGTSTLKYDSRGNIVSIVDAAGAETQYIYDGLNRIAKTIDALGNETCYEFDLAGNIVKETNALGYERSFSYSASGKVASVVEYNGGVTTYKYNELNKVSEITDPMGGVTKVSYDRMWNISSVTDPEGGVTRYIYNKLNRLEKVIDPVGNETQYEHDFVGNITKVVPPNGNTTELRYDPLDRVQEVIEANEARTVYEYDAVGNIVKAIDPMGGETVQTFDLNDQLLFATNPAGETVARTYNALGQVETVKDGAGNTTRFTYDLAGRMISVTLPAGERMTYVYDALGNLVETRDALNNTTIYQYDPLGRIISITDALGHTKHFTYDKADNVTGVTDENGNITQYHYDLLGNLTEVIDALGHSTKYSYDALSNLSKVDQLRIIDSDLADAQAINERQVTEYKRDKNGRVISVTDPLGGIVSYSYDAMGNIIEKQDKDGSLTKYGYDAMNNLARIQYADSKEVKLSYNPLKQLIEIKDWLGITDIQVDALGRATQVTHPDGKTVGYTYSANGKRESLTYPDGSMVTYTYDASGNLKGVNAPTGKTSYSYDPMGRLAERALPNGAKTHYALDPLNRLTELRHLTPDGVLDQYTYAYDPAGNTTQIEKWRKDVKEDTGVYQYAYDPLNRLIQAGKQDDLREYAYDSLGNRTRFVKNGQATSYTFNALNQLIRAESTEETKEYAYDPRGNLQRILRNGKLDSLFEFDATGMLAHARTSKGESHYRYNGMLKRIQTLQSYTDGAIQRVINYTLDPTLPYFDLLHTSGTDAEQNYIWGNGLVSANNGSDSFYYMNDQLGSPVRLLGKDKRIKASYAYDEFGNIDKDKALELLNMGAWNPFGFTGYQPDKITGMDFAQARFYQPTIGRFVSEDWIKGKTSQIQTLNEYTYSLNNPHKNVDYDGKTPVPTPAPGPSPVLPKTVPSLPQITPSFPLPQAGPLPKPTNVSENQVTRFVGDTLTAVWESLEGEVGIGQGIGFEAKAAPIVEASLLFKADYINIRLENGKIQVGNAAKGHAGLSAYYNLLKVGDGVDKFHPFSHVTSGEECLGMFGDCPGAIITNPGDPKLTIGASIESYVIAGFTASIEFNINKFLIKMAEVIENCDF